MINLSRQIEEDIGSAEEQPISNKFDIYTKNGGSLITTRFPLFIFI